MIQQSDRDRMTTARARREVSIIVVVAIAAFALSATFDVMELITAWSEQHDSWQIDEIVTTGCVVAVSLCIFALRRMHELKAQMASRAAAELSLRASEARLQKMFVSAPLPMMVVSNAFGTLTTCNPEFEAVTGFRRADVAGKSLTSLNLWTKPESIATLRHKLQRDGRLRNEEAEFTACAGELHHALLSAEMLDFDGQSSVLIALNDMTERRELEEQLQHQAFHDTLTGLANRALFRSRLDHALARAPRSGSRPVVLYLDLDDFKRVNDSQGHAAGDELLQSVAKRLQNCLRTGDTCARLGGDEFCILVEDATGEAEASQLAQRIILTIQAPYELSATIARVGVSVGIALAEPGDSGMHVMRNADLAMYLAKSAGKGRFVTFEPAMQAEVLDRLSLEADLQNALELKQFELHYQPIVSIDTGDIVSVEALLRWQHPTRGLLSPTQVIPIAESTGLIIELGQWILNESCRAGRELQLRHPRAIPISISVNISARQIAHPEIVTHVAAALQSSGLPAVSLILEMTESMLVHNEADVLERLWGLKRLGCRLAIDDFGTGYSSLAYLQQFPVDILKIDKSFTDRLGMGVDESPIARAVVALGNTISLQTVAEGIETTEQWDRLRELGCERGQGFLFARPGKMLQVDEYLRLEATQRASGNERSTFADFHDGELISH